MKKHTLFHDEHRLWVSLHQISEILGRYEDNFLKEFNLTKEQYLILWVIESIGEGENKAVKLSDVSSRLLRKISSTSLIVNRMEKNGLVRKYRDLPDQRAIRLVITPKAKEIFEKSVRPYSLLIQSMFSIYSPKEIHTLEVLINRLREKMKTEGYLDVKKMDPETCKRITELFAKENI